MATTAFAAGAYAATQGLSGLGSAGKPSPVGGSGVDFSAFLKGAVDSVAQSGKTAEAQALSVATGKADIVDVVTAVAESEAAMETLVAVRDRVISAYEDIMRMPI
jgi:flagellar hook-basal body complex protein FliE